MVAYSTANSEGAPVQAEIIQTPPPRRTNTQSTIFISLQFGSMLSKQKERCMAEINWENKINW